MDCNMPIKSGYDAAYEIKTLAESENFVNATIFALSAYNGLEDH